MLKALYRNTWVAAIVACLLGFIPLIGWLASVLIGVVTFELGVLEGFIVAIAAAIPELIQGLHGNAIAYWSIFFSCFYIWAMAWVLRDSKKWLMVFAVSGFIALVLAIILYIIAVNIDLWWYHYLMNQINTVTNTMKQLSAEDSLLMQLAGLNPETTQQVWQIFINDLIQNGVIMRLTRVMTITVIVSAMIVNLFNLVIARWWYLKHKKVPHKKRGV